MLIWISLSDQVVNVSSDLQARRLSQANTQAHRQLGKDAHTHDFHNNHKPLNHNLLFIIWYCERIPQDWTLQWSMTSIANWVMLAGRWLQLVNQPPEGLIKLHNGKSAQSSVKKKKKSSEEEPDGDQRWFDLIFKMYI